MFRLKAAAGPLRPTPFPWAIQRAMFTQCLQLALAGRPAIMLLLVKRDNQLCRQLQVDLFFPGPAASRRAVPGHGRAPIAFGCVGGGVGQAISCGGPTGWQREGKFGAPCLIMGLVLTEVVDSDRTRRRCNPEESHLQRPHPGARSPESSARSPGALCSETYHLSYLLDAP